MNEDTYVYFIDPALGMILRQEIIYEERSVMKFEINLGKMSMDESSLTFDLSAGELVTLSKNETFRSIAHRLTSEGAKEVLSKVGHRSITKDSPDTCGCKCHHNDQSVGDQHDDITLLVAEVKDTDFDAIADDVEQAGVDYLVNEIKSTYEELNFLRKHINNVINGFEDDNDEGMLQAINRAKDLKGRIKKYKDALGK